MIRQNLDRRTAGLTEVHIKKKPAFSLVEKPQFILLKHINDTCVLNICYYCVALIFWRDKRLNKIIDFMQRFKHVKYHLRVLRFLLAVLIMESISAVWAVRFEQLLLFLAYRHYDDPLSFISPAITSSIMRPSVKNWLFSTSSCRLFFVRLSGPWVFLQPSRLVADDLTHYSNFLRRLLRLLIVLFEYTRAHEQTIAFFWLHFAKHSQVNWMKRTRSVSFIVHDNNLMVIM